MNDTAPPAKRACVPDPSPVIPLLLITQLDTFTGEDDKMYLIPLNKLEGAMREAGIPVEATDYRALVESLEAYVDKHSKGEQRKVLYAFAENQLDKIKICAHNNWGSYHSSLEEMPLRLVNRTMKVGKDADYVHIKIKYATYM